METLVEKFLREGLFNRDLSFNKKEKAWEIAEYAKQFLIEEYDVFTDFDDSDVIRGERGTVIITNVSFGYSEDMVHSGEDVKEHTISVINSAPSIQIKTIKEEEEHYLIADIIVNMKH